MTDLNFQRVSAQIVSTLTRILGPRRLSLAEEAAQDALVKALQLWPHEGVPSNPTAWLIQVAKNRALDLLRRDQRLTDLEALDASSPLSTESPPHAADTAVSAGPAFDPAATARLRGEADAPEDDELAMMFLACHPMLSREARVALTLKTVCGFGVREIARAFLAKEEAIAQRLVRAKRQLRDADVAFELTSADYPARLESVLDVLYLLFNEGYAAHTGDNLVRAELCREAIRLGELLAGAGPKICADGAPAVHALLALMYLQAARLPARTGGGTGDVLLRLADQDRALWDARAIARGLQYLDTASAGETLTVYHVEAGIAACHAVAARYEDTDWGNIVELYDLLIAIKPTPIVALNRAIAVSRLRGPRAGLAAVEAIAGDPLLARYYLLHATVGDLALECGDRDRAADGFTAALACECSEPERRFLEERLRGIRT
ncbi:MAG TPA: sigma-70 family RNA polymerase sigma factor [Vicinamibacterales bacterium]|nr:sigma-70 family RNA polymerase sigma factor [Vicinamibacterales bacterium]